jgi:hypothetical protein
VFRYHWHYERQVAASSHPCADTASMLWGMRWLWAAARASRRTIWRLQVGQHYAALNLQGRVLYEALREYCARHCIKAWPAPSCAAQGCTARLLSWGFQSPRSCHTPTPAPIPPPPHIVFANELFSTL